MDSTLFKEIQSHNSIHHHYLNTLMIANLFKDQVFYIPTFMDFRGRLYSKVSYLSYQGGDMARSLIQFYSPNDNLFKIKNNKDPFNTSLNYIKQYAGNVYNLSKKNIKTKIKWCDTFINDMKEEFDKYYITNISNIRQREVDLLLRQRPPAQRENIKLEPHTKVSESTLVNLKKVDFDLENVKDENIVDSELSLVESS